MKLSARLALTGALLLGLNGLAEAQSVSLPSCQALSVCLTYRVNALQLNPGGYILYPDGTQGTTAGSAPSGPAGGDLTGTYPNPNVDSLGAISGANLTNLTGANLTGNIAGQAGSVASGGIDFSTITTALSGKQASGNYITALTGNVTASGPGSAAATIVSVPQSAVDLSTVTAALGLKLDKTGTSALSITGASGSITTQSSVTASAFFGNGTSVTNVAAVSVPAAGVIAGSLGSTVIASSVASNGVTAGTYGSSADSHPNITIGVDGRVTSASNTSIQITESQVTNLTTDLATKASTGTNSDITQLTALNKITSAVTMTSSMTNTSSNGILSSSSMTASAFFGDGSHLTGVMRSSETNIPNTTFTNTTFSVAFATVTLTTRGGIVVVNLVATGQTTNNANYQVGILVDGAFYGDIGSRAIFSSRPPANNVDFNVNAQVQIDSLAAGTHSFGLLLNTAAGTGTLLFDATHYAQWVARETQQ